MAPVTLGVRVKGRGGGLGLLSRPQSHWGRGVWVMGRSGVLGL